MNKINYKITETIENYKDKMFQFLVGYYNISENDLKTEKLKICNSIQYFYFTFNEITITKKIKIEFNEKFKLIATFKD